MGDNMSWLMFLGGVVIAMLIMGAAVLTMLLALFLARRPFLILSCGGLGALLAAGWVVARFLPQGMSTGNVGGGPPALLMGLGLTVLSFGFLVGAGLGGLVSLVVRSGSDETRSPPGAPNGSDPGG